MKVCLAPTHLLRNTSLGGHAWVFLNWALGLRDQGCQIVLLEKLDWRDSPEELVRHLRGFRQRLSAVGLGDVEIAPMPVGELPRRLGTVQKELADLIVPLESVFDEADLLLNFKYSVPQEIVDCFPRSALVDIDPGLLQMWICTGTVRPAKHDIYFTIGETVGRPGTRIPDCGIEWHYTRPPVHLPSWPATESPAGAPYTTVTNWWGEYEVIDGEMVNNEKRTEFLRYLDLPGRAQVPLELAIYHEDGNDSDMPMLIKHGWQARPAHEVSGTPYRYRSYIQSSRGEFSCAKRSCMHFENAWISDRTICYLASGKPAVVQHTGESRFLPDAEGLIRFRNLREAVSGLRKIEADYEHHAEAARDLAAQHFDAAGVLADLLGRATALKPKPRPRRRTAHVRS